MINIKKHNFTGDDQEWSFEDKVKGAEEFQESVYQLKGVVDFHIEMSNDNSHFEKPQVFQENALNYFSENERQVFNALCEGVLKELPEIIRLYKDESLSEIKTIADVKRHVSIDSIHVLGEEKDNISYLGFDCGCSWDPEHGLGVVLHKERCIEVGDAQVASMCYEKILHDRMTEEEYKIYKEEYNARAIRQEAEHLRREAEEAAELEKAKRKWWMFWK